jgi:hypothetical protein
MILVIGIIVVLITITAYYFLNNRKDKTSEKVVKREISLSDEESTSNFPNIQIVEDLSIIPEEKNKIIEPEIKDAVAILDNATSKGIMAGQNIRSAGQLLKGDKAFFSAAKEGTENMLKVKGSDKVYGIQMKGKAFSKQTQFKNEGQLVEGMAKNSLVNAGFNAASMVVGQYYIAEINEKMETIQHDIKNISSYLDSEYQGKIDHIISKLKEIVDNKNEILNNEFSRDKRYDEISREEANCTILLGQANSNISVLIENDKLDYKKYESTIKEIQKWYTRQQILIHILLEIGNLRYILAYGNETSMFTHTQYNNYLLQTNNINQKLRNWHNLYKEKLGIDQIEHKRNASFYKMKKKTIAKIKEDWAYNKLDEAIEKMISNQTTINELKPYLEKKQDDCIKILKQGGNYYNLLEKK